jgi:anti-sigma B factor antagonist
LTTANKLSQAEATGASGNKVTVLRYTGDISSASRDTVLGTYATLDPSLHKRLLLDFVKVDYLNSSGIALVIQLLIEAGKAGQQVAICGLTPHFTKVFTMVGIAKYATLYPNEGAALAAL